MGEIYFGKPIGREILIAVDSRCLIDSEDMEKSSVREANMGVRIDVHTYKLLFEAGKEDTFWRKKGRDEEALRRQAHAMREVRNRTRWLK